MNRREFVIGSYWTGDAFDFKATIQIFGEME